MVRFVRSAKVSGAKLPEAIRWAKDVADYVNSKDSGPKVRVYSGMFGDVNTIFWEAEQKDLASIETFFAKLTTDAGYWAVVNKSNGMVVDGSVRDSIMNLV